MAYTGSCSKINIHCLIGGSKSCIIYICIYNCTKFVYEQYTKFSGVKIKSYTIWLFTDAGEKRKKKRAIIPLRLEGQIFITSSLFQVVDESGNSFGSTSTHGKTINITVIPRWISLCNHVCTRQISTLQALAPQFSAMRHFSTSTSHAATTVIGHSHQDANMSTKHKCGTAPMSSTPRAHPVTFLNQEVIQVWNSTEAIPQKWAVKSMVGAWRKFFGSRCSEAFPKTPKWAAQPHEKWEPDASDSDTAPRCRGGRRGQHTPACVACWGPLATAAVARSRQGEETSTPSQIGTARSCSTCRAHEVGGSSSENLKRAKAKLSHL